MTNILDKWNEILGVFNCLCINQICAPVYVHLLQIATVCRHIVFGRHPREVQWKRLINNVNAVFHIACNLVNLGISLDGQIETVADLDVMVHIETFHSLRGFLDSGIYNWISSRRF